MDKVRQGISWTAYLLVALIGLFVIIKINYLFPRFSDGNVYLYLSHLVSQGAVPYQDFFYSSPPFILYLFSFFGRLFGFNWQTFSYIPLLLTALDAALIYRLISNYKLSFSRWAALAAAMFYLFSFTVLATTDFTSDVHVVTTLILLSILAKRTSRAFLSGILLGLATMAKLYAIIFLPAWLATYLWHRRRAALIKFSFGFFLTIGAIMAVIFLAVGHSFYDQVILSHLGLVEGLAKKNIILFFLRHDWVLMFGLAAWPLLRRQLPAWILFPLLSFVVFIALWHDSYFLYFKILVAYLALLLGWIGLALSQRYHYRQVLPLVFIAAAVGVLNVSHYLNQQAHAAVIQPLDQIVRYVADHTQDQDTIYGSFEITPLVSLLAHRPLWRNFADTNVKFFQTNWFDYATRAEQISRDQVPLIITKAYYDQSGRLLFGPQAVLPLSFFHDHCRLGKSWPIYHDYTHNAVIAWRCHY